MTEFLSRRAPLFALALLALAGPVHARPHHAALARAPVVEGAWMRPATMGMTAAYFTVRNQGPKDERLIGVETPEAASASLHATRVENGVARMVALEGGVPIAPGETVRFAPGENHVMVEGLKHPLKAGDKVKVVMRFQHAGSKTVVFVVSAGPPASP